jgi:hypothetical protein
LLGGIKVSRLKHTVVQILDDDQTSPKIPQVIDVLAVHVDDGDD